MGGCRCVYRNCESSTTTTPGLHYFHFPVRDPNRCEQWLINARKPILRAMPKEKLRNKVVCSLHFEDRCFTNSRHDRLIYNAVPTLGCEDCPDYEEEISNSEPNDGIMLIPVNEDNTKFTLPDVEFSGMTYTIYDDNVVPSGSVPATESSQKVSILLNKPKRPKFMVTSINKIIPGSSIEDTGSHVVSYSMSGSGEDLTLHPSVEMDDVEEICSYSIEDSKSDGPLLDNDIDLKPKRNNEYTMSVITTPINCFDNLKKQETSRVLVKEIRIKPDPTEIEPKEIKSEGKNIVIHPEPSDNKHQTNYVTYRDTEKNFIIQTPQMKKQNLTEFKTTSETEYINMIEDNAKQIRNLKRLINKQNKLQRYNLQKKQLLKFRKKPNKYFLLNALRNYLKPSLMAILKMEILPSDDVVLTDEEEKFLLDLYNDNPECYKVLLKEYKWKLPGYESFLDGQ